MIEKLLKKKKKHFKKVYFTLSNMGDGWLCRGVIRNQLQLGILEAIKLQWVY